MRAAGWKNSVGCVVSLERDDANALEREAYWAGVDTWREIRGLFGRVEFPCEWATKRTRGFFLRGLREASLESPGRVQWMTEQGGYVYVEMGGEPL